MAAQAADCDSDPATYWDTADCDCKETANSHWSSSFITVLSLVEILLRPGCQHNKIININTKYLQLINANLLTLLKYFNLPNFVTALLGLVTFTTLELYLYVAAHLHFISL